MIRFAPLAILLFTAALASTATPVKPAEKPAVVVPATPAAKQ